ncbi:protein-disulfide reductase DsbD [Alteromonas sp. 14N.309.X.WAT.G.H12]|uniref:protein-disulfide reductase DsbD n=1 Tax=Alteromonas sp. 14N.309.X.WAT.G.H12 TaxID=3120824 RepID=UPI002FD78B4D
MKYTRIVEFTVFVFITMISMPLSAQSFDDLVNEMNRDPMSRVKKPPLPVEQAFVFGFSQDGDELTLRFTMPKGYHLYKDKLKFNSKNAKFGKVKWPPSEVIDDPFYGPVPVYSDEFELVVPILQSSYGSSLAVAYQGCSPTFCYPPRSTMVLLDKVGSSENGEVAFVADPVVSEPQYASLVAEEDVLDKIARKDASSIDTLDHVEQLPPKVSKSPASTLEFNSDVGPVYAGMAKFMFLIVGIGLALTPCVYPMYPILASVVVGKEKRSAFQVFKLSMAYVQGMAFVYAAAGVAVALLGLQFQQALQEPYLIGTVAIFFVILAGSQFGFYTIQLPARYQTVIHEVNPKQAGGSLLRAFVMGALSGLVASPCTTAPLAGVLMYIAQTGDVLDGFLSLYLLSIGMGVVLITFALSGSRFLPNRGVWMNVVKELMGFVLLGVAIYFAQRVVSSLFLDVMLVSFAYAFSAYVVKKSYDAPPSQFRFIALFAGLAGILLAVHLAASMILDSTTSGARITSGKLEAENASAVSGEKVQPGLFKDVTTLAEIKAEVAQASTEGKPVMLDLYAQWCQACLEFEARTFSQDAVRDVMSRFHLIRVDLTASSDENVNIQEALGVIGLPTILFYGPRETELTESRLFGFAAPTPFISHLNDVQVIAKCEQEMASNAVC